MTLGEFIKNFTHNNIVRLLYKCDRKNGEDCNHTLVLDSWNDVSMDWEIPKGKGKFRHYVNNQVLGLTTVYFGAEKNIHHQEALNIVIEKLDPQPQVEEMRDTELKCINYEEAQ